MFARRSTSTLPSTTVRLGDDGEDGLRGQGAVLEAHLHDEPLAWPKSVKGSQGEDAVADVRPLETGPVHHEAVAVQGAVEDDRRDIVCGHSQFRRSEGEGSTSILALA